MNTPRSTNNAQQMATEGEPRTARILSSKAIQPMKSETRNPKAERRPKAETRRGLGCGLVSRPKSPSPRPSPKGRGRYHLVAPIRGYSRLFAVTNPKSEPQTAPLTPAWSDSAFGFRPSFGLRVSAFGFGHPLGGPRHALQRSLPMLLPLPFRRGEGRGEGSFYVAYPMSPSV